MSAPLEVAVLATAEPALDAELEAFFSACPSSFAQQTSGWRDAIRSLGADEPMFLGCRRAGALVGVLPAYRFAGPLGAILNSVPQAGPLGGVACLPEADPEPVYAALLRAFAELGASTGCALASLISNPFWPDRDRVERHLEPDYVLENVCQVLDLSSAFDAEGSFVGGSANLRRNLRKAQRAPLRIDEEQSAANVEAWYTIHAERHREIGATPLPRGLFLGALLHMVPRDRARFFFVRRSADDEMVGGGFYVHHGAVIDALMPSVRSDQAKLGVAYRLALHSMRWARERGLRFYNWQASPPGSGVYRFKRQWGSRDVHYAYLTRITGDAEPFLCSSVERVQRDYRWHYVLPFDRIGAGASSPGRPSAREAAWNAAAGVRR